MRPQGYGARAALCVAVVAQVSGCSLVVGDIELPPTQADLATLDGAVVDAAYDAGLDALTPDLGTPDADLDATADLAVDAEADAALDAEADAALPDAEVPGPLAIYAGDWHLYGVTETAAWGGGAFAATLRIDGLGQAVILDLSGGEQAGSLSTAEGDLPLSLAMGAQDDLAQGVLDVQSGLGSFVGGQSVVWAVRAGWSTLPEAGQSGLFFKAAAEGAVYGHFDTAVEGMYESSRVDQAVQARPDVSLGYSDDADGRRVLVDAGGGTEAQRVLTPFSGGALGWGGEDDGEGWRDGLWIGAGVVSGTQPPWPVAQRYFCAGLSSEGETPPVRGQVLALDAEQQVLWETWGDLGSLVWDGSSVQLSTAMGSGFFGAPSVVAWPVADGRGLVLLNTDAQTHYGWGAALCVSLAPPEDAQKHGSNRK